MQAPEPPTLPDPAPTEHGERGYEPVQPGTGLRELLRRFLAPILAVGFVVLKWGAVLLKLKVFTTAASMLVSIAAYAWIWGLPFAVGFVALIFVHELGQVVELRRQGVPASAPLFIPFLGAPQDTAVELADLLHQKSRSTWVADTASARTPISPM